MSKKEDQPSGLPEWPNNKPEFWFACAISLGLVGLCIAPFAIIWAFQGVDEPAVKDRMAIIAPVGTLFLAVITFFTVAWRGMVTSAQAEQQRRQNDAKDDENLAKLLIDGTKLATSKDAQSAEILAGIAALRAVVTSSSDHYASAAMDVLVTVINRVAPLGPANTELQKAVDVLNEGPTLGRFSSAKAILQCGKESPGIWPLVKGARRVRYINGTIGAIDFQEEYNDVDCKFINVRISSCDLRM